MSLSKENKVVIDGQTYYGDLNQSNLKFVKVDFDCWEKIFDLLSLRDILAMSQTCQRMRQIGGQYSREKFHDTHCGINKFADIDIDGNPIEREDFLRSVDTIKIDGEFLSNVSRNLEHLRHFSRMNLLGSLTTLILKYIDLNEHHLHGYENIQTNIETIQLDHCVISDNSVGEFLASCPKLKSLRLEILRFQSTTARANLFQRTFPMLEHFQYFDCDDAGPELISFLERNPSIKCLRIAENDLQKLYALTTIQLDYLNISVTRRVTNANDISHPLRTLHANGFFKKLRVSIGQLPDGFDGELFMREVASFGALEVLTATQFYTNAMCHLPQLKELHLHLMDCAHVDLEAMATNLVNLERLYVGGFIDQLSSFLRHSNRLKFVVFHDLNDELNALNLFDLNRVRQMGGMQRKIRIGVSEWKYLATKWNEKNVNYDLVEISREETIRKHFYNKN